MLSRARGASRRSRLLFSFSALVGLEDEHVGVAAHGAARVGVAVVARWRWRWHWRWRPERGHLERGHVERSHLERGRLISSAAILANPASPKETEKMAGVRPADSPLRPS
jgi:hypothetical protein